MHRLEEARPWFGGGGEERDSLSLSPTHSHTHTHSLSLSLTHTREVSGDEGRRGVSIMNSLSAEQRVAGEYISDDGRISFLDTLLSFLDTLFSLDALYPFQYTLFSSKDTLHRS